MPPNASVVINTLVVNFSMPALLFSAIHSSDLPGSVSVVPLLAALTTLTITALSLITGLMLKIPRPTLGAYVVSSAFGNTGFFGYPVSFALYGQALFPIAVYYDLFGTAILQTTLGTWLASRFGGSRVTLSESLVKVALFPPLWGVAAGFILRGHTLPAVIVQPLNYLGQVTVPLMLISMGFAMKMPSLNGKEALVIGTGVIIKLLISPLAVFALTRLIPVETDVVKVMVSQGGAPSMLFAGIISMRYGLDVSTASNIILFSTLLCTVSIPLLARILF